MWELASGDEPYSDYEIDEEDKLIRDIINGKIHDQITSILMKWLMEDYMILLA
ncbi:12473_t:CDS:2 [Rhizophagus irregularis]|uniref:Uncharacterized protein n=1 Tax=Rhizophagus irregularis (strain DAOM 181602 / DAOM 197198 / MUCL 43194) TaxID=747089 RepID=U9UP42_RHIID|nr:12473_t:CDS:2 [Rhizophagus irregularis]